MSFDPVPRIIRARQVLAPGVARANAIAVIGDRIAAVGDAADLRGQFPTARLEDRDDAVISPGFNDAHLHLAVAADDDLRIDVSPAKVSSLTELLDRIGAAAKERSATGDSSADWLQAVGYDDGKTAGDRVLTRWDLDTVTGDIPAMVTHVAGHWSVVNSAALTASGITEDSEPPSGGEFGRDGNRRLNGVLYERAADKIYSGVDGSEPIMPKFSLADRLVALRRVIRRWHAAGLTSVCDAWTWPDDIRLYAASRAAGDLTMRVGFLVVAESYDVVHELGLRSGFGDDHLRFVGVKAFSDGAIAGRTCMLDGPTHPEHRGIQMSTPAELAEIVRRVHDDGNQVAVHANGEHGIRVVLDEYEAAARRNPKPGLRHRIEHCTVINDEILDRMRALDTIAVPLGNYVQLHGANLVKWYGAERAERMFAHRSFLDAGIAVAGSSDYPCGPVEPLLAMQGMTTRTGWDGALIGTSQRVSAAEALSIYTAGSALATGEADRKGVLRAGQLADFVLLDEDPSAVPHSEISAIGVRATFVGGDEVYTRDSVSPTLRTKEHSV